MSTKEKLIERFISQPKDFTFDELTRLFEIYGFIIAINPTRETLSKHRSFGTFILFYN